MWMDVWGSNEINANLRRPVPAGGEGGMCHWDDEQRNLIQTNDPPLPFIFSPPFHPLSPYLHAHLA